MPVIFILAASFATVPPLMERLIISATANMPISAGTRCTPSHKYSTP